MYVPDTLTTQAPLIQSQPTQIPVTAVGPIDYSVHPSTLPTTSSAEVPVDLSGGRRLRRTLPKVNNGSGSRPEPQVG